MTLNETLFEAIFSYEGTKTNPKIVPAMVKVDQTWFKSVLEPVIGTSLFI